MTPEERRKIRAMAAKLAGRDSPAEIAAAKCARVLQVVTDGPTMMSELCADLGARGEGGRKQWEGVIRCMRRRGDVVIGHMMIPRSRGVRVAPVKVVALPEHAGSLEVVR